MTGSKAGFECTRNISENMYTLAARIEDADHGADWLDSCAQSFMVRDSDNPEGTPNRITFEAYERLKGLPIAGIADRDVYLHGAWHRQESGLVCDLFPSARSASPPPQDVVRMRDIKGKFCLSPLAGGATRVTYALNVDLGGAVPEFIKNMAVKEIPRKSLDNLARQAQKGAGLYKAYGEDLKQALDALASHSDQFQAVSPDKNAAFGPGALRRLSRREPR